MISDCQLKPVTAHKLPLTTEGRSREDQQNQIIIYCIKHPYQCYENFVSNKNYRMHREMWIFEWTLTTLTIKEFQCIFHHENDKWHVEVDSSILHAVWLARGVNNKTTAKLKGRETKLADMNFFVLPNGWACKDKICFNLFIFNFYRPRSIQPSLTCHQSVSYLLKLITNTGHACKHLTNRNGNPSGSVSAYISCVLDHCEVLSMHCIFADRAKQTLNKR